MTMARETAAEKEAREAVEAEQAAAAAQGSTGIEPVEGGNVHVPQVDGEIVFTNAGTVRTFTVKDHIVKPETDDERAALLLLVSGSKLAD